MFDIGWPELLVVAIIMVVVVGPKDLPRMLRAFGKATSQVRSMAGDFRRQFDEALKEAELDDVKNVVRDVRSLNPKGAIRKELASLDTIGREMKADLHKATKPDAKPDGSASPQKDTGGEPATKSVRPAAPLKGSTTANSASTEAATPAEKPAIENAEADQTKQPVDQSSR